MKLATIMGTAASAGVTEHDETSQTSASSFLTVIREKLGQSITAEAVAMEPFTNRNVAHSIDLYDMLIESDVMDNVKGVLP